MSFQEVFKPKTPESPIFESQHCLLLVVWSWVSHSSVIWEKVLLNWSVIYNEKWHNYHFSSCPSHKILRLQETWSRLHKSEVEACVPGKEMRISHPSPTLKCLRGSAPFPPVTVLKTTIPPPPFPGEDYQIFICGQPWKLLRLIMCK